MTIEELAIRYEVDESMVARAIVANGFTPSDVDESNEYLVKMHVEYLIAMKEADEVRNSFSYQDGEESVNKSSVYDNYRRHFKDLETAWKEAKNLYDRSKHEEAFGNFHIRRRAPHLDRGRNSVRRTSRRGY